MTLEVVPCYLCGSNQSSPWARENGHTMVKCEACGLVYLNPRPRAEEIDAAARTGLHRGMNAVGRYSAKRRQVYRERLTHLTSLMPRERWRWLDIGAGFGELVQAVQDLGAIVEGIEPCEPKVRVARAKHLPVSTKPLHEVTGRFTHVSLVNVYSHLPDPVEFLRELHRIMEPGAYLLMVTGNGGDIPRHEFPGSLYLPDHLSFAGEENLRTVLQKAGYDVVGVERYADTPSLDSAMVTMAKNVVRRLTGRAPVPMVLPKGSGFRSLWIVARLVA